jgi:hypothetical protein
VPAGAAQHHGGERDRHPDLGDHRAERRPGNAQARGVHEQVVEAGVGGCPGHRHDQRGADVQEAAQCPGGGEDDEHGRQSGGRDPQVGDRVRAGFGGRAEAVDEGGCCDDGRRGEGSAECGRQPESVDPVTGRGARVPGAERAADRRRRGVGQEDAQVDQRRQHRAGHPETGQRGGAEVADDGGVGQQEQRLGD